MAINIKLPKRKQASGAENSANIKVSKGRMPKGKMPTKTYINLLPYKKQSFSLKKNLPLLILIILLLVVVGKFLIYDRLAVLLVENNRIATMKEELANTNRQIDSLRDLEDEYAHYTTSGMTSEELGRVDRVQAMKLIDKAFLDGNISRSWNLTGNIMTLQVSGPSLSELNQLALELEERPIVERCVISSADKRTDAEGNVQVTFIIYLQNPWEDIE